MASIAEQICSRIHTLLLNATAAGVAVYRDRDDAFTREETPAILIEAADEQTDTLGGSNGTGLGRPMTQIDRDTLRISITVCVRSAAWQQVADAVRVQVHALLVADSALRALATNLKRDRCEWRSASTDVPFGYAAQGYQLTYLTRAHALDVAG